MLHHKSGKNFIFPSWCVISIIIWQMTLLSDMKFLNRNLNLKTLMSVITQDFFYMDLLMSLK
jgi:hypothetical protein